MEDYRKSGIRRPILNESKDTKIKSRIPANYLEQPKEIIKADHFEILD
jgi:hypothetical protein